MPSPEARARGWLPRIPLHIKVMVSYMVVVGLVFVPTILYLRTLFQTDIREGVIRELEEESAILVGRLEQTPPEHFEQAIQLMLEAMPRRVTIIDLSGRVLGDTAIARSEASDHSHRPEVIDALEKGVGRAIRLSSTTGDERIYVARRYPREGPARGVVRLSVPSKDVTGAFERGFAFINQAGALGLSAAVLLSLVAALVVSRPLRRIAESARAFAAGDFGHAIDVDSNDELGEAAQALRDMATQLRGTLVASGADRATLQALLADLPCGVILYDAKGGAASINGRARELCDFSAHDEEEKAAQLLRAPEVAAAVERVKSTRRSQGLRMAVTGAARGLELDVRLVPLYGPDGNAALALVVSDGSDAERASKLGKLAARAARALRTAAKEAEGSTLAAELERAADEAEVDVPLGPLTPDDTSAIAVSELCQGAAEDLSARLASANIGLDLELAQPGTHVVEAGGRARKALRKLIQVAISESPSGSAVRLYGEVSPKLVTFSLHCTGAKKVKMPGIAELVHPLGGDAGSKSESDGAEVWLKLPRA